LVKSLFTCLHIFLYSSNEFENTGESKVNSSKYFAVFALLLLGWVMACSHSGNAITKEGVPDASAAGPIEFDFADGASLPVVSPVEKNVLTLKNFRVGTGKNRILIVGVQAEEMGKDSVSDMLISSVTYGVHALTLIPNSEVELSSIWFKDNTEYFTKVALYYLLDPPSGQHDITVTYAGPVKSANVGAISLFNAKQTAPLNVVTNKKKNPTKDKEIVTKITTRNDGAWVIDFLGCGKQKSRLENKTQDYNQRFEAMETTGGKSTLVGGTLFVPTAGEITLRWVQRRWTINRLAYVAVEIAPYR